MRVFDRFNFVHIGWEAWAKQEVMDDDVLVFARGTFDDPPLPYSFPNIRE